MVSIAGACAASRHDSRCQARQRHDSRGHDEGCGGNAGVTCLTVHQRRPSSAFRGALSLLALLASGALLGCSEDSADPTGVGGSGTSGAGGTSAGGQAGSAGTGGSVAAAGTGGGSTTGGTGGTGATADPILSFDFAEDIEGWVFTFADPVTLVPAPPVGDAGVAPTPEGDVATAVHDPSGDPLGNAGSVRLELPFSGPAQKISFEVNVAAADVGVNLAGRSISARISVLSGYSADPMNPPGLKLYVKTGATSLYADSGYTNVATTPDWQTFIWANVSSPLYTDPAGTHAPTDVRQIGIEFDTGAAGLYTPATILLDSVNVY